MEKLSIWLSQHPIVHGVVVFAWTTLVATVTQFLNKKTDGTGK